MWVDAISATEEEMCVDDDALLKSYIPQASSCDKYFDLLLLQIPGDSNFEKCNYIVSEDDGLPIDVGVSLNDVCCASCAQFSGYNFCFIFNIAHLSI